MGNIIKAVSEAFSCERALFVLKSSRDDILCCGDTAVFADSPDVSAVTSWLYKAADASSSVHCLFVSLILANIISTIHAVIM